MQLTLCKISNPEENTFAIQATATDGTFVDLYSLSGESYQHAAEWEALEEVGTQEEQDTDAFWLAVDASIAWIASAYGIKAAWASCGDAYDGILNPKEKAGAFKKILEGQVQ